MNEKRKSMYIQIFNPDGVSIGAEYLEDPVFVRTRVSSGKFIRCEQRFAEGVVSKDENSIYLKSGIMPHGIPEKYFVEITQEEYEHIKREEPDPEDDDPVVPPDVEEPPMTRAELTEKVAELENTNAMLLDCLMEMSEIVYA